MKDYPQILLQPENPQQLEPDDLLSLAAKLKELNRDYDIRIASYEGPPADPDVEYEDAVVESWTIELLVWVSSQVGAAAISLIVGATVNFAKKRFQESEEKRPIRVELVRHTNNEQGEVTETFTIESPDEEAIHRILSEHERYPLLKPTIEEDEPKG